MAITTKGRSEELEKAKEKIIKFNPMGKTAQKEAALKKFPERKFKAKALIESLQDEKTPMKKTRLEDSVQGKKMVFKKSGGRIGLKHGSYKDKANPHIDQKVYVTKSGKEEASFVDKESVMKTKKQRKMAGPQARKEVKHGGSMCKLATKGKGRAYGKNS